MERPRIQEQMDLVHSMVARYPNDPQMTYTADDIVVNDNVLYHSLLGLTN
jgi:hypothetical protein